MSTDQKEPDVPEDEPLTPEEQAEWDEIHQAPLDPWESEAVRTFGPRDERLRKNREYVALLVAEHSEPTIRGILKALSARKEPMCCDRIRDHDLDLEPLEQIIRPFELLGLNFRVLSASEGRLTVDIGEGYGDVGSGGEFVLERLDDGSFRVMDVISLWIA